MTPPKESMGKPPLARIPSQPSESSPLLPTSPSDGLISFTCSNNLLSCPVCYHDFDRKVVELRPRIIPCGHSFCESCLTKLGGAGSMKCPIDRKQYRVLDSSDPSGWPVNYQLLDLIEVFRKVARSSQSKNASSSLTASSSSGDSSSPPVPATNSARSSVVQASSTSVISCSNCETEATLVCRVCKNYFCDSCDQQIHMMKAFASHNRVPKEDCVLYQQCEAHLDKDAELFCKSCKLVICTLCGLAGKHRGHDFITIDELRSYFNSAVSNSLTKLESRVRDLAEAQDKLSLTFAKGVETTTIAYATVIQLLNERKDALLGRVRTETEEAAAKLVELERACTTKRSELASLRKNLVNICADDIGPLYERVTSLVGAADSLTMHRVPPHVVSLESHLTEGQIVSLSKLEVVSLSLARSVAPTISVPLSPLTPSPMTPMSPNRAGTAGGATAADDGRRASRVHHSRSKSWSVEGFQLPPQPPMHGPEMYLMYS